MYTVQVNNVIDTIISGYYRMGIFHRGDKLTRRAWRAKLFYCVADFLFVAAMFAGAMVNENPDMSIFLLESTIVVGVFFVKLCFFSWRQHVILDLLNRICVYSVRREDDFNQITGTIKKYSYVATVLSISGVIALNVEGILIPACTRTLCLQIGFPMDYRNDTSNLVIAATFSYVGSAITVAMVMSSTIVWYLLLNCSLRYEVLSSDLRNLGRREGKQEGRISEQEQHKNFLEDLKASIGTYLLMKELITELMSLFSNLFFAQICTSGICICGSIYSLGTFGFTSAVSIIHIYSLILNISEIFMITYIGNGILLNSNELTYSLFQSDWINQPQPTKLCLIIFSEHLKQPHQLVVGKLYPLILNTFTRILRSAYSLFNILQTMKK